MVSDDDDDKGKILGDVAAERGRSPGVFDVPPRCRYYMHVLRREMTKDRLGLPGRKSVLPL